ncbi:MAG: methyltransferase domain-containing protein [Oscillospiraceae bacterium]|nr:methyltransferase domain-containing protein [Oscillospiraceae bacterium]
METGYEAFSFYYDQLTENVQYPQRAAYFHRFIQKYQQAEGNVLLDLACGTGSLSEEMAKLGYDVLGVDYSYGMLNQAVQKKLEHNLPIQYICQDMRQLELYGTVDVTVCALDSLNHLDSFADVRTVFQQIAAVTEPGGLFIFDMNTPYKHREVLGDQIYLYDMDDVYCVWENHYEELDHQVTIQLHFFARQEDDSYLRSEETMTERAYPSEQVTAALQKTGFQVIGCYHADTEEPLRTDSQRMVFVARKEKE